MFTDTVTASTELSAPSSKAEHNHQLPHRAFTQSNLRAAARVHEPAEEVGRTQDAKAQSSMFLPPTDTL